MRAVFIGAGSLAVVTAKLIRERGEEVVIIEQDKERIDALAEQIDCGFLYGDGSKEKVEGVVLAGDTATVTHTFSDNDQFEVDPGVYTYKVSIYAFDAGVRLEANSQSISIDTN